MARISGIDLPKNKRGEIGLTYIYGIGRSTATLILESNNIDVNKKVNEWSDDELSAIRKHITEFITVEGELRSEKQLNIKLSDDECLKIKNIDDIIILINNKKWEKER